MADTTIRQLWTIRGDIDAECARCHQQGVELVIETAVEGRASLADDEVTFDIRLLSPHVPIKLRCLSCGWVVNYGEAGFISASA